MEILNKKTCNIIKSIVLVFISFIVYSVAIVSCNSNSGNTSNQSFSREDKILLRMAEINAEYQKMIPLIENSYNSYRNHLNQGYVYGTSPEWGNLIDYKEEIIKLCDEYIRLARQLSDNEDILSEALQRKQAIINAFDNMGLTPSY